MMSRIVILLFVLAAFQTRLPGQTEQDLQRRQAQAADAVKGIQSSKVRLFLYSISPEFGLQSSGFHGYSIRGETEIVSAQEKDELLDVLGKSFREGISGARCFNPRHGLRVVEESTITDFVICFECEWVSVHESGSGSGLMSKVERKSNPFFIGESARESFERIAGRHVLKYRRLLFWGAIVLAGAGIAIGAKFIMQRRSPASASPALAA